MFFLLHLKPLCFQCWQTPCAINGQCARKDVSSLTPTDRKPKACCAPHQVSFVTGWSMTKRTMSWAECSNQKNEHQAVNPFGTLKCHVPKAPARPAAFGRFARALRTGRAGAGDIVKLEGYCSGTQIFWPFPKATRLVLRSHLRTTVRQ